MTDLRQRVEALTPAERPHHYCAGYLDCKADVLALLDGAEGTEAVTEEWLRSIGFVTDRNFPLGMYLDPPKQDIDLPRRALIVNMKSASLVDTNNIDRAWLHLCDWKTRADVLALLSALKINTTPRGEA